MALDLFEIYKGLSQRAKRNPLSFSYQKAKELGRELLSPDITLEERLHIAKSIESLERRIGVKVLYGTRAKQAIETDDWTIHIPYQIRHRWEESKNDRGFIYAATAVSRPNEIKLGATKSYPYRREKAYKSKYGYPIKIVWYCRTQAPFSLEKQISDSIAPYRVSGLTFEDSNEWYKLDLNSLILEIKKAKRSLQDSNE